LDVVLDPFSGVAVTAVADRLAVSVPVVLHCGRGERALCSCKRLNSTQRLAIESLTFPEMEADRFRHLKSPTAVQGQVANADVRLLLLALPLHVAPSSVAKAMMEQQRWQRLPCLEPSSKRIVSVAVAVKPHPHPNLMEIIIFLKKQKEELQEENEKIKQLNNHGVEMYDKQKAHSAEKDDKIRFLEEQCEQIMVVAKEAENDNIWWKEKVKELEDQLFREKARNEKLEESQGKLLKERDEKNQQVTAKNEMLHEAQGTIHRLEQEAEQLKLEAARAAAVNVDLQKTVADLQGIVAKKDTEMDVAMAKKEQEIDALDVNLQAVTAKAEAATAWVGRLQNCMQDASNDLELPHK
jgi:DNA repair exonuclease SbcCD ATPase subunit